MDRIRPRWNSWRDLRLPGVLVRPGQTNFNSMGEMSSYKIMIRRRKVKALILEPGSVSPEFFQGIVVPGVPAEDMDEEGAVVHEDPLGVLLPLDAQRPGPCPLELLFDALKRATFWREELPCMMTKKSVKEETSLRSRTRISSPFLAWAAFTASRTSAGRILLVNFRMRLFGHCPLCSPIKMMRTDVVPDGFRDQAFNRFASRDPPSDLRRRDVQRRDGQEKDPTGPEQVLADLFVF